MLYEIQNLSGIFTGSAMSFGWLSQSLAGFEASGLDVCILLQKFT